MKSVKGFIIFFILFIFNSQQTIYAQLERNVAIGRDSFSSPAIIPYNGNSDYSWTSMIYGSDNFHASDQIIKIGFYVNNNPSNYVMQNQRIYFRQTTATTYPNGNFPGLGGFTLVYDGSITYNGSGWAMVTLTTPFFYNKSSNLEVLCINGDGSKATGFPIFRYSATGTGVFRVIYNSNDGASINQTSAGQTFTGRPNVRFVFPTPSGVNCNTTQNGLNNICGDGPIPMLNLNGHCGRSLSTFDSNNDPSFCGGAVKNNTSWLKFTATATTMKFNVIVDNCGFNGGVQIAVYDAPTCNATNMSLKSNCWNPTNVQPGEVIASGLTVGNNYFILVDGYAGDVCSYNIYSSISSPLTATYSVNDVSCTGLNDGAISIYPSGGTKPYKNFNLSGAATQNNQTGFFNSLASGTYSVSFQDNSNTLFTVNNIVVNPSSGSLTAGSDVSICSGESTTLTASGAANYTWTSNPNVPAINNPNAASITVSPTVTTDYTVSSTVPNSNLIFNSDFEAGNTGFGSTYDYFPNNAAGAQKAYGIVTNAVSWFPTFPTACVARAGNMMIVDGSTAGSADTVWSQTVPVQPGTQYSFSYWLQSIVVNPSAAIRIVINGVSLGNYNSPGNPCQWVNVSYSWNSGTSTFAKISIINDNTSLGGNDFAIDDISFKTTATTSCNVSKTVKVTINNPVTPTFPTYGPFCKGAILTQPILPTTSTDGITGSWNPAGLNANTPGSFPYTFTPAAGQCATTYGFTLKVNQQIKIDTTTTPNTNCNPTPCNYTGPKVVINELHIQPTDNQIINKANVNVGAEWIELYNPSPCQAVDLSCYMIGNYSTEAGTVFEPAILFLPPGTTIPPLGFLTIGGATSPASLKPSQLINGLVGNRLYLPDGLFDGGWLGIWDANGTSIDAVYWMDPSRTITSTLATGSFTTSPGTITNANVPFSCPYRGTLPTARQLNTGGLITRIGNIAGDGEYQYRTSDGGSTWQFKGAVNTPNSCNSTCATPVPPSCNGTATANVTSGTGPFTYQWNDPAGQTTPKATGLCAGKYTVTVKDADNLCTEVISVTVTDNCCATPPTLTFTAGKDTIVCDQSTFTMRSTGTNGFWEVKSPNAADITFASNTNPKSLITTTGSCDAYLMVWNERVGSCIVKDSVWVGFNKKSLCSPPVDCPPSIDTVCNTTFNINPTNTQAGFCSGVRTPVCSPGALLLVLIDSIEKRNARIVCPTPVVNITNCRWEWKYIGNFDTMVPKNPPTVKFIPDRFTQNATVEPSEFGIYEFKWVCDQICVANCDCVKDPTNCDGVCGKEKPKYFAFAKPTINPAFSKIICEFEAPFLWEGQFYNTTGTYTKSLKNKYGCDSSKILNLTVIPLTVIDEGTVQICENTFLPWYGQSITSSGSYEAYFNCEKRIINVIVIPAPALNAGPALSPICQGGTTAPMNGAVGSGTGSIWSGGTGTWSNANDPAAAKYTADPSENGTITLTLTTNGGVCGIRSVTKELTVKSALNAGNLSGTQTICALETTTFSSDGDAGGSWTSSNTSVATVNASGVVSGVAAGTATITYTVTGTGGCTDAIANRLITVNPLVFPSVTINNSTTNNEICPGEAVTFTATPTNGGTSPTYQWRVNGNNVGTNSDTYTTSSLNNNDVVTVVMTSSISACVTNPSATSNTITIKVKPLMAVGFPNISNATLCVNTPLPNTITHTTTSATGIVDDGVSGGNGLPLGIKAKWANNTITISGTPAVSGTFNYSIPLTGGCGTANATGTIVVNPENTISLTSASGTNAQTACVNTSITDITYQVTGATSVSVNGLPNGVSDNFAANTLTISGMPVSTGSFTYTVTLSGGCGTGTTTGNIKVKPDNTISLISAIGTDDQSVCINTAITPIQYSTTGITGINSVGFPAGVNPVFNPANGNITISGTPLGGAQTYNYEIQLLGGCGTAKASGKITVANLMSAGAAVGLPATICVNSALPSGIRHSTVNVTNIGIPSGLPAGVTAGWIPSTNQIEIAGTPQDKGKFTYTIPLTGGCGSSANATGTLIVLDTVTVGAASGVAESCVNTVMSNITHDISGVSVGLGTSVNNFGLPLGVNANISLDGKSLVISGTPVQPGEYNYAVNLVGTCGSGVAKGTIRVKDNISVGLPSVAMEKVCVGSSLNEIIHITGNASGLGVPSTSLPPGVTPSWSGDTLRISGTPSVPGVYKYKIEVSGLCGAVIAQGKILVLPISVDPVVVDTTDYCQDDVVSGSPNVNAGGIVRWYTDPSGGTGSLNSPSVVTGTPGIVTFYATQQLPNACESRRVPVVVRVNAKPRVDGGPNRRIDLGQSVVLNGTAEGNNPRVQWIGPNLSNPAIATPSASPKVTTVYTIRVVTSDGCVGEDTVRVVVLQPLDIPNVFSPNGDGVHDKWIIPKVEQYPNCVVQIFNRYGVKVYDQRGYNVSNAWDGTNKGQPLPVGAYYYILNYGDGKPPVNGVISIIR